MTDARVLAGAVGLLERSLAYTSGSLQEVTPAALQSPTPCRRWHLDALLTHMYDSLAAIGEAADLGHIGLRSVAPPGMPIVSALQDRACALLGGWVAQDRLELSVGPDRRTGAWLLAAAGALEITVHGWDVAMACGVDRPIPEVFADELLDVATMVVGTGDRPGRFAEPVTLPAGASASDSLLAFLGRSPR